MASTFDLNALFRVDGMVAVITGGGTGIGLVMARALAGNGARAVYILGRRMEVLTAAAALHPSIVPVQCDVTSKEELQAAVDKVGAEVGYVNLLVANSGAVGPRAAWEPGLPVAELRRRLFTDFSLDAFADALRVNTAAAFFTMTAFLQLLDAANQRAVRGAAAEGAESGPGPAVFGAPAPGATVPFIQAQVVFTSSISAFSRQRLSGPAYVSSKAAIMQLTKFASTNLATYGIRVNSVAPGLFPSELTQGIIASRKPEEESADDPRYIPARRIGTDDEMAGLILYLAGRAGAYCNGSILVSDGGRLAIMPASY